MRVNSRGTCPTALQGAVRTLSRGHVTDMSRVCHGPDRQKKARHFGLLARAQKEAGKGLPAAAASRTETGANEAMDARQNGPGLVTEAAAPHDVDEHNDDGDDDDAGHPVHTFYATEPDGLVRCKGCNKYRLYPHVTRQTRHAVMCPHITRQQREALARGAAARKKTRRRFTVAEGVVTRHFQPVMTADRQMALDAALTEFITASELPFRPFASKLFHKFTSLLHTGYRPPSASALAGTLLDANYVAVQARVQSALEAAPWLSLIVDGWDDIHRLHYSGVLAATPKPFFLEGASTGTQRQTEENIGNEIARVAEGIAGSKGKISAVVTDNAAAALAGARRAASLIVQSWNLPPEQRKYTEVWVVGCAAHWLQLVVGDICKAEPAAGTLAKASTLVALVRESYLWSAAFQQHEGTVVAPVATRWGSHVDCLHAVIRSQKAYMMALTTVKLGGGDIPNNALEILNDVSFWATATALVDLLTPIIRCQEKLQADGRDGRISAVYPAFRTMETAINSATEQFNKHAATRPLPQPFCRHVTNVLEARRDKAQTRLHLFAHVVDPETAVTRSWAVPPTTKWRDLDTFIESNMSVSDAIAAHGQLSAFMAGQDPFDSNMIWEMARSKRIVGADWWRVHFMDTAPQLAALAARVLDVPASSAAVERVWSSFGRIQTDFRNRLAPDRLHKLVYVSFNGRALSPPSVDA